MRFFGGFFLDNTVLGALLSKLFKTSDSSLLSEPAASNSQGGVNESGTNGDDTLTGTPFDDKISGRNGDDLISGLAGDDNLDGNNGNDTIFGGEGDDDISGNNDDDELYGGAGNDDIAGGNGNDIAEGGEGNDTIDGMNGIDTAVFNGSIVDFEITDPSGPRDRVIVTDLNTADGDEGVDQVDRTEFLQFDDFTLAVGGDNPPLVLTEGGTTDEDTVGTFVVNAYEFDGDGLQAPVVTYTGPGILTLTGSAALTPGTGTGTAFTFEFDPNGQFETLAVGDTATETITFSIADGNGNTTTVSVDVLVTGVNDPPVANDDTATTDEDQSVLVSVLGNDTDVDAGDTLTVVSASALNGTVVIQPDGQLLYTPDPDYNGPDTITYTIEDSQGAQDSAEVAVTVNPVNDAPVSQDTPVVINEADGVTTIDLNTQVIDAEGDPLSFSGITINRGETLIPFSVGPDGSTIIIDPEVLGLDTGESVVTEFFYTVSDGNGGTDTGVVQVTINGEDEGAPPGNSPPVAADLTVAADEEDGNVQIALTDLISDPDEGDVLEITSLTTDFFGGTFNVPFNGGLTAGDGGEISFDPTIFGLEEGETATITLNYTVEDAAGATDSGVITLNLTGDTPGAGNTPPTAPNIITPPGETPQVDPFGGGVVPSDVIVGETGAIALEIDLDDFISDPDGPGPLVVTVGDLVIGTDETTGAPIIAPTSFDPSTNILTITLDETFPLADGESAFGTLEYQVSDGIDTSTGAITFNYVNPVDPGPSGPETLDFEEFDFAAPSISGAITESMGFGFEGSAVVVETDEIVGNGRDPGGVVLGQTTDGGQNVLVGTATFTETLEPVLDEFGEPVIGEDGAPLFELVSTLDDEFAILAPGLEFGVDDGGLFLTPAFVGGEFVLPDPLPEGTGTAFDLNGISLNVPNSEDVTVTITTYELALVETPGDFGPTFTVDLVEVDSFDFVVNGGTPATEIDFEASDFGIGLTGANPTPAAFDDIYAVQITTDDGTAVVIDDVFVTL